MTAAERATLDYMLSVDDPRVVPLRLQADHAEVVAGCECGCATIDFAVDQGAAPVAPGLPYAAIDARRRQPFAGDDFDDFYEMIVFARDGWLSSLEVVWYRVPIASFPGTTTLTDPTVGDRSGIA